MPLKFTKMQATGNDFVVVDNRDGALGIDEMVRLTPALCDRKLGIGADGTLFLCKSDKFDFTMVYRNADGSDAGMCGNGGRAISLFACRAGLGDRLRFDVHDVPYSAQVDGEYVTLYFDGLTCIPRIHHGGDEQIFEIFTGTEHIVVPVSQAFHDDIQLIRSRGRDLRYSELFAPKGTNVNFCTFKPGNTTVLSTYERGVEDLTLACGTGSIATAIVAAHIANAPADEMGTNWTIQSPGGMLHVSFKRNTTTGAYFDIRLSGEAKIVFEGSIDV